MVAALVLAATVVQAGGAMAEETVPDGAKASRWTLIVQTTNTENAGTDADIYLGLTWKDGGTFVKMPDLEGDDTEAGDWNTYNFSLEKAIPVHLLGVQLTHSNTGEKPGWHVGNVMLIAWMNDGDKRAVVVDAKINRWLAVDEKDGIAAALKVKSPPVVTGQLDENVPNTTFESLKHFSKLKFLKADKVSGK
jgi:hypothetical protein